MNLEGRTRPVKNAVKGKTTPQKNNQAKIKEYIKEYNKVYSQVKRLICVLYATWTSKPRKIAT